MVRKGGTLAFPHSATNTNASMYQRHGESAHKKVKFYLHNDAMPAWYSTNAATDASRRLSGALANPAPSAPFARFGAQTMDTIRQVEEFFFSNPHTHNNPHTTPTAYLWSNPVTYTAGKRWPPRTDEGYTCSVTTFPTKATTCTTTKGGATAFATEANPFATTEGGANNYQSTPKVPHEIMHMGQLYSGGRRWRRRRFPRGAWPCHGKN